ncbi:Cytochrome P450 9e2 [Gryllus bimaculatus]|nr:Cytochrome P450 9e2 [Gryllus bimaculatus]
MACWMWRVLGALGHASWVEWWLLGGGALLLFLYWLGTRSYDHFRRRGMPFARPLPFVGSMAPVLLGRLSMADWALHLYSAHSHLPASGFFQFARPMLLLRDPDLIRAVTVKAFDHFVDHQQFNTERAEPMFARILLGLTDGVFEVEMKDFCSRLTNDIIASSAFGIECDSLRQPDNEFYRMGRDLTNIKGIKILILFGHILCPKIMEFFGIRLNSNKVQDFFHNTVHATINERQKKGIFRPDMLQQLMQAREGILKAEAGDEPESIKGAKLKTSVPTPSPSTPTSRSGRNGKWTKSSTSTAIRCRTTPLRSSDIPKCSSTILKIPFKSSKIRNFYHSLIHDTIKERQQKGIFRPDMLQLLMQAREGQLKAEAGDEQENISGAKLKKLTDLDMTAQAVIFFFAGFDTVSTAMSYCAYALARHPEVQQRLQREVDETFEKNDGKLTYEAVQEAKYLDMFISGFRFALLEAKVALAHILRHLTFRETARTPKEVAYSPTDLSGVIVGGFWILGIPFNSPQIRTFYHSLIHDTIKERQQKGIFRPDMLQLLMQAREGQLKAEAGDEQENISGAKLRKLTDQDMTSQAVIFFFAGFETVSTAMSYCAYALARHPEVQQRLQREVDEAFEKNGGKLTYEAVQEAKYLDMFISGFRFALLEAKVALAHILRHLTFQETARTPKEVVYSPTDLSGVIVGGFWVGLAPRAPRQ